MTRYIPIPGDSGSGGYYPTWPYPISPPKKGWPPGYIPIYGTETVIGGFDGWIDRQGI